MQRFLIKKSLDYGTIYNFFSMTSLQQFSLAELWLVGLDENEIWLMAYKEPKGS
mgnify:CR=1 FL=1